MSLLSTLLRQKEPVYEPLYDEVYDEEDLPVTKPPPTLKKRLNKNSQLSPTTRQKEPLPEPLYDEIVSRQAELEEIDREALSKLSPEDRELLLTELTPAERISLILEMEKAKSLPIDENRFGAYATGGFASIGAKIGAGAGGYLGARLAGPIGAKLGSAAGAYLGAAAASRLEATFRGRNPNNRGNNVVPVQTPNQNNNGLQYGGQAAGGYSTFSSTN